MTTYAKPMILAENLFELGTPTATDTDADTQYDALNIMDRRTYTYWLAASAGTKYLTIDCGTVQDADTLAIIGHNLYTANATVSVEWSADGASWTEALAGFVPTSDGALLKTFTTATKRYWRIKVVTASIAAKIAVAFIGARVDFPKSWPAAEFDPWTQQVVAQSTRSKTGNLLGNVLQYVGTRTTLSLKYLDATWIDGTFRPLWNTYLSQLYPVFFAWELTNHATEVHFVKIPDDYELVMPFSGRANLRNLELELEGVKE